MNQQLFHIKQNAIIKNVLGDILILRHHKGKWVLPGGGIDQNENWLSSLKRELQEEIGLEDFNIAQLVNVSSRLTKDVGIYIVTFEITTAKEINLKLSGEHTEYAWVNNANLSDYEFWFNDVPETIKSCLQ